MVEINEKEKELDQQMEFEKKEIRKRMMEEGWIKE